MFKLPLFHRLTSAVLIAGFAALGMPATSSSSILPAVLDPNLDPTLRDYRECSQALTNVKLPLEEAEAACAQAFNPQDFSQCVVRISRKATDVAPGDAVSACRRVRRPVDLSSCYTLIRDQYKDAAGSEVLNSCRLSLLPTRYARCVVGLGQANREITSTRALSTCIDASELPTQLAPTFIPFTTTPPSGVTPPGAVQPNPIPAPAPEVQITPVPVPALY
jgi:hypothetical protein